MRGNIRSDESEQTYSVWTELSVDKSFIIYQCTPVCLSANQITEFFSHFNQDKVEVYISLPSHSSNQLQRKDR